MSSITEASSSNQRLPDKVTLRTADGKEFVLELEDAMQSLTLKNLIEEGFCDGVIPLPNVTAPVLSKVIEFFKRHREEHRRGEQAGWEEAAKDTFMDARPPPPEELQRFEKEFVNVDRDFLFELVLAANYLDAKMLLDVTCQAVADAIKEMSVEDVRDYFGIENDYTPEEEEVLRGKYHWAFQ